MVEIPHSLDGVRLGQHFANYFVDTARYSSHKPESPEEELQMLIYSTPPVFSARFEVGRAGSVLCVVYVHGQDGAAAEQ
jgi:gamma-glutamyl hydrolase